MLGGRVQKLWGEEPIFLHAEAARLSYGLQSADKVQRWAFRLPQKQQVRPGRRLRAVAAYSKFECSRANKERSAKLTDPEGCGSRPVASWPGHAGQATRGMCRAAPSRARSHGLIASAHHAWFSEFCHERRLPFPPPEGASNWQWFWVLTG
jgi:hypothetical protein